MTIKGAGDHGGLQEWGIRFFIRCIYCSIIGSVARDNGHSLTYLPPPLRQCYPCRLASVALGTALNDRYDNAIIGDVPQLTVASFAEKHLYLWEIASPIA